MTDTPQPAAPQEKTTAGGLPLVVLSRSHPTGVGAL